MSTPRRKRPARKPAVPAVASKPGALAADIRQMIDVARQHVAQAINAGLTVLHWQIGGRIRREILGEKRADYGAEIVSTLSRQLEPEFGRGFSNKALRHMIRFAEAFPDPEIVSALSRQLAWSHFKEIIYLKDELQLCAGKKQETVEYLDLGRSGIHVAEYLTELPPREVLHARFHQALAAARARLDQRRWNEGQELE